MVREILKGLAWAIVAVVLALLLQRPVDKWLDRRAEARRFPHQVLVDAESDRGRWTQTALNLASQKCQSLLQSTPEVRAQAFQVLSRTYSDWAALRFRLGLPRDSYPDRALAYAFEAQRAAPQAIESEIALAYAFESLEAGGDKKPATKVKVQNLVDNRAGGPDLEYLNWVTHTDKQAESYPDQVDLESVTNLRFLVDLGNYFAQEARKQSGPQRENLLKRASDFCDRALLLAPANPLALFCKGYTDGEMGNTSEAREYYVKALQSEADFPRARNNLGYTYAADGDFKGAKNLFEAAVVTLDGPLDSKAQWLHNLGSADLELNQSEKACDAWKQAAQLPGSANSFLAFWGLSLCSHLKKEMKESLDHYRKAVELGRREQYDLTKLSTFEKWKAGPNELQIAKDLIKAGR
jgi:hypothetical protein